MTRMLEMERGVLTFRENEGVGSTMLRIPLSPKSVDSCHAEQIKETQEVRQLELVMPVRGKLVLGTKHGDSQDTLVKILKVCRAKGIDTKVSAD